MYKSAIKITHDYYHYVILSLTRCKTEISLPVNGISEYHDNLGVWVDFLDKSRVKGQNVFTIVFQTQFCPLLVLPGCAGTGVHCEANKHIVVLTSTSFFISYTLFLYIMYCTTLASICALVKSNIPSSNRSQRRIIIYFLRLA